MGGRNRCRVPATRRHRQVGDTVEPISVRASHNDSGPLSLVSPLSYLTRPIDIFRSYRRRYLRSDTLAGLTVAVVMLPQAIAYARIAGLPARTGLYAAVVSAIIAALWGSSNQLQTGPTNTGSLVVLSTLLSVASPGTPEYLAAAGLLAVMVGVFRLSMGLARLGVLVNFISDSVIVGFTSGAGPLIAFHQVRDLLQLPIPSTPLLWDTVRNIIANLPESHWYSLAIGLGTILLMTALDRLRPGLPGALIGMMVAAATVWGLSLDTRGIEVLGQLPQGLPPVAEIPWRDVGLIERLATGAIAIGAIELVEVVSISRSIASRTGQRLDSDQEFVGQGLANIACGILSGYTCSGSFSRSAVNYEAGAQTSLSNVFAALFVLVATLVLAPLAAYVPLPSLAGVLIVTCFGLIDRQKIKRIWAAGGSDRVIMVITILATLLLPLQYAVLGGIGLSIVYRLLETSRPRVRAVTMSEDFRYFTHRSHRPPCPQLGVVEILGDLYFGAVSHIEERIEALRTREPTQRFLLLRMYTVENCDISGIHALESIVNSYRDRGGDVYFVHVQGPVMEMMASTGFDEYVGQGHFLNPDRDVSHLFYKVLDPAVCIYECPVRAFEECQNLPKQLYEIEVAWPERMSPETVPMVTPEDLWSELHSDEPPTVIDVREPREFDRAHIPQARLVPLPRLLDDSENLPQHRRVVLTCRGGRRSRRAAAVLRERGHENVSVLDGGMLAWEHANLLEAVDYGEEP